MFGIAVPGLAGASTALEVGLWSQAGPFDSPPSRTHFPPPQAASELFLEQLQMLLEPNSITGNDCWATGLPSGALR